MQLIYSQQLETNDWRVIYNGSQSGQVYSNWIFIDAEQSKEGGIGWMNQYRDTSVEIEYRWSWQVEGGKQAMYMNWLDQQDSVKFKVLFNSGTNGYSEYYLNNVIKWKVDWNGTNSNVGGMWYIYNNGALSRSGSWGYST